MLVANFKEKDEEIELEGLWQYDYGQKLQITGLELSEIFEVHFFWQGLEKAKIVTGHTENEVSSVDIPNEALVQRRMITAYIYLSSAEEGETTNTVRMFVNKRPAPENFEVSENVDLFHYTLMAAAEYLRQAKIATNEANNSVIDAEAWAHGHLSHPERNEDNAKYYAEQAKKEATSVSDRAEEAKKDINSCADEKIEEMKQAGKSLDTSVEEAKKINSQLVTNNQSAESAEKKRIAAENSRKEAETKRASAETERKQAEEQRVQETQQAITNANKATEAAQAVADNVSGIIDEKILEAFFGSMRTGKVYQTELYLTETNPTSAGTKTLANEGKVCEPSTDTVEGRDDYEGIGIFNWYNCNYITDDYGRKIPTAIEGWGNGYKNDGSVDVGVIAMTPYWSAIEKDGKQIWTLSDTPNDDYGLIPWETARKEDGTYASYVVHSKYISGLGTDGLLRSFFNSKPFRGNCYNNMIDNYQKKGKACWGAGKERDMYVILHVVIKYATKNEQKIFRGTTSYSLQFSASIQREVKETYFPLTNSQASQIVVGSYVSVGYGSANGTSVNNDRGVETIHNYADDVKVLRIEDIDENNKAVYLDIEEGFTTTPVELSDTLNAPITLSTMHWWSGSTDKVIGKHDGSMGSNTDGKHPFRVMGLECSVGGYIVYSDSVMVFKEDYSKDVYIAPRGVKHAKDEATIKSTYKLIGNMPGNDGVDWWIGDIGVDMETCSWFAKAIGNSDSQGWGDRCYAGGKSTSGTREDLGRGDLGDGSGAGSAYVYCGSWLGRTNWDSLGCD